MEDTMNNGITIRNFATMIADVARIEEKKETLKNARRNYDEMEIPVDANIGSEELDRYLATADRYYAAEKAYKTALTIFLKKYNTEKYGDLNHDVRYYHETRPYRMYEMIRDRMMRESRFIEFSI